jgi:diguanylate cyclase
MADAESISNTESRQARLLKRYWIAAGSSFLVFLFMFALSWDNYLNETGFYFTTIGILFSGVLYFALFRSGLNLKASDPSLTIPQVLTAIVILTIAMYYTSSSARSLIEPIVLMAFVFGVFRLDTRKLVYVALIAIMCYALMIWLLLYFRPQEVEMRLEVLRLMVFGPILLWFAVMGGYISRLRKNLSDRKSAMEEMSIRDPLTGAHNRRYLLNMLRQEESRSDRSGEAFCIAILDLDFFKTINDRFGHQVGDEVLKACATCGTQAVRPMDCFGRYGGEEFEVVLAQTNLEDARTVAERIRSAIDNLRFPNIDPKLNVTVSIGIAQYHPKESAEETEKRADVALYRAKALGRNRIETESANAEEI